MKTQHDIASYVSSLRARLHLRAEVRERIVSEAEEHLQDRAAAHVADGMDRREAESMAVAEFGPAWRVALRFRLAYLDLKRVVAWAAVLGLISYRAYGTYPAVASLRNPALPFGYLPILVADIMRCLGSGVIVLVFFPRRLLFGAGVVSAVPIALSWWFLLCAPPAGYVARHIRCGWQSGFYIGLTHPASLAHVHKTLILRDSAMITDLAFDFVWAVMGVWVAGAIGAKLPRVRRSRPIS